MAGDSRLRKTNRNLSRAPFEFHVILGSVLGSLKWIRTNAGPPERIPIYYDPYSRAQTEAHFFANTEMACSPGDRRREGTESSRALPELVAW